MKTVLGIILYAAFFLYVGETKITASPFSISIERWTRPVGITFVCLGMALYSAGEYNKGRLDGQNEAFDACMKALEQKKQKKNENEVRSYRISQEEKII